MLDRIAAIDNRLHSYITVMGKDALTDAKVLDEELAQGKYRGPLHGVPVGVKDLLYTPNAPTTGGHLFKANFIPSYNATVVDRLHNAGAVILGKLNLTEGATGGYNSSTLIPKNPWGEDLWTGLSSSGSGVATAAGREGVVVVVAKRSGLDRGIQVGELLRGDETREHPRFRFAAAL